MAKVNNYVTLNVKSKHGGIVHVQFELLKDLGNNRYILYAQERLCIGIRSATGLWTMTSVIDLLDGLDEENCKELIQEG